MGIHMYACMYVYVFLYVISKNLFKQIALNSIKIYVGLSFYNIFEASKYAVLQTFSHKWINSCFQTSI